MAPNNYSEKMSPLYSIVKRSISEDNCCVPGVTPVSDSSASSSSCCDTVCGPASPLTSQLLHIPLEVGGTEFHPVDLPNKQKRVSFGELEIRKYPLILGDHPECCMGPPLTIDWEYFKAKTFPIDAYESKREPRRTKDELIVGWIERKQILRKLEDATDEEMRFAAYEAQRVRDQRNQTKKLLRYESLYVPIESFNRKLRRAFRRPSA